MLNIICFTKDMSTYGAAYYQKDFLDVLEKKTNVFFYGIDFPYYNKTFGVSDVLGLAGFDINSTILIFSHSWLSDSPDVEICLDENDYYGNSIFKVLILNKEYSRLDEKIEWAKEKGIDLIFTHHTDNDLIEELSGIRTIFWPFAVNPCLFCPSNVPFEEREYDLSYSGILQNLNVSTDTHSDQRVKVLKEIYRIFRKKILYKKMKYRSKKIYYNFFSSEYLNSLYKRLNDEEYIWLQHNSKFFLNTLSAGNLIGTRFFENMLCKTVVFCEDSPIYNGVFPDDLVVKFNINMSDFFDKLDYYLKDIDKLKKIADNAYDFVIQNHTWEHRVDSLIEEIKILNGEVL